MNAQSPLMFLLLLIVPIVLIFVFIKKKKNKAETANSIKKRREDDEVWKTIKKYVKENDGKGKEIVESYVAKRLDDSFIDHSWSKEKKKAKKEEIKQKKLEQKKVRQECKKNKKKYKRPPTKELYVVLFTTRNAKTFVEDKPRAIECEVINEQSDKKQVNRKILVNKECDYEKEYEWIAPIKAKEELELKKRQEKLLKKKQKKQKKPKKEKNDKKNN